MSDASATIAWVSICEDERATDCPLRLNVTLNSEGIEGGGTEIVGKLLEAAAGVLGNRAPPVINVNGVPAAPPDD